MIEIEWEAFMKKVEIGLSITVLVTIILTMVVIFTGVFIIFFPIEENTFDIITPLVGIIGAVLGGAISGVLTLIGVKLSIKASFNGIKETMNHQEKERVKETTGLKLNKLYRVKEIIYRAERMLSNRKKGWNENYKKDNLQDINDAILVFILPELNNLLELSASVDWEFYEDIKKFVDQLRALDYFTDSGLDQIAEKVSELAATIELNHEKRLSEQFKEASF